MDAISGYDSCLNSWAKSQQMSLPERTLFKHIAIIAAVVLASVYIPMSGNVSF